MSINSICMCVKLTSAFVEKKDFLDQVKAVGNVLLDNQAQEPHLVRFGEKEFLLLFHTNNGSHATVRLYKESVLSIDIQHMLTEPLIKDMEKVHLETEKSESILALEGKKNQLSSEYIHNLENRIRQHFMDGCSFIRTMYSPITRGSQVWPYAVMWDDRLLEYDFDQCVHESRSSYQHIAIYHSPKFGNVLFLDGEVMLGESDDIYTNTLCCIGEIDYKDKEVLILGGGDGGVLNELLKHSPKFVLMAEIDDEVMKACSVHMKSVCGSVLDKRDGHNFKIEVTDCLKVLQDSVANGKTYDVVINDLTEYPVKATEREALNFAYDFETAFTIMELSVAVLTPTGKVLARGQCTGFRDYHSLFVSDLNKLDTSFKEKVVHVPSFCDEYSVYEIWKNNSKNS